jgi:hypothetical protein
VSGGVRGQMLCPSEETNEQILGGELWQVSQGDMLLR